MACNAAFFAFVLSAEWAVTEAEDEAPVETAEAVTVAGFGATGISVSMFSGASASRFVVWAGVIVAEAGEGDAMDEDAEVLCGLPSTVIAPEAEISVIFA
jgi:hypothetical protein